MFFCERCQSSFNATIAASGECPRCRENDGLKSNLRFRLFEPSALRVAGLAPQRAGAPARIHQPAK